MITGGIDVGIESLKAVILNDGKVLARSTGLSGGANRTRSAEKAWGEALKKAKLTAADVNKVVATGQGKNDVAFARDRITEPVADARAARFLYPEASAVVDIGADQVRLVALSVGDSILEVVMNQKCAAGLGIFLRSMARTLEMTLEEMSQLTGDASVTVNDGCGVFAEMDALGLLNRDTPREEVARAAIAAAAVRISSVLNDKVRPPRDGTVLVGGLSRNTALVNALKKRSGINFMVPEEPEFAGALGAALLAGGK